MPGAVTNVPIYEQVKDDSDGQFMNPRTKDEADVRTYTSIAKQYGFDPKADETKLDLRDVLQKVIDSEWSDDRLKALAKENLELAIPGETITFKNDMAGSTGYNEVEQVIIDARYSAHEYKEGRAGLPIEHHILHAELQRRTSKSLEDTEGSFYTEMAELHAEAEAAFGTMTEEQYKALGMEGQSFLGLQSVPDFVREVMTNAPFQNYLATVKTDVEIETSSVWKRFIDSLLKEVGNFLGLGKAPSGTVLNAALQVISTNSVNSTKGIKVEAEIGAFGTVTATTSAATIKAQHPTLYADLIESFKEESGKREEGPLLSGIADMNNEDIGESEEFTVYLKEPGFTAKKNLIKDYNESIKADVPKTVPVKETSIAVDEHQLTAKESAAIVEDPNNISEDRLSWLAYKQYRNRPYSKEEQTVMNVPAIKEKVDSIKAKAEKNIPKGGGELSTAEIKALKKMKYIAAEMTAPHWAGHAINLAFPMPKAMMQFLNVVPKGPTVEEIKEAKLIELQDRVASITNYKEYEEQHSALIDEFGSALWEPLGEKEILKELENKKEGLKKSVNFKDIQVNDGLVLKADNKDGFIIAMVKKKNKKSIKVMYVTDKALTANIKESELADRVLYKYSEGNKDMEQDTGKDLTAEDKAVVKESGDTFKDINNREVYEEKVAIAKGKTSEERKSSLLNAAKKIC